MICTRPTWKPLETLENLRNEKMVAIEKELILYQTKQKYQHKELEFEAVRYKLIFSLNPILLETWWFFFALQLDSNTSWIKIGQVKHQFKYEGKSYIPAFAQDLIIWQYFAPWYSFSLTSHSSFCIASYICPYRSFVNDLATK